MLMHERTCLIPKVKIVLRRLDTLGRFAAIFFKDRLLLWPPAGFLVHQTPFQIKSTLKRKALSPWEQILLVYFRNGGQLI